MMQKIIYASQAIVPIDPAALQAILDSSRKNNAPVGITGFLLYADDSFLQILEGESAALDDTYSRIVKDPRHTALRLLERAPINRRRFSDWSMGFDLPDAATLSLLTGYTPTKRFPLVSPELVRNGVVAEMVLSRYATA